MLDELRVQNVALIEDASLAPASGLTVLTGETGAGKTALLSSIKLLVGERADASAVREGTDALHVDPRRRLHRELRAARRSPLHHLREPCTRSRRRG